jgi:hypothetical protein
LDSWMRKALTLQDAVVLEMTTNAFQLYDDLLPHVHSVTPVHPPHVTLITCAQVMMDKMAAMVRLATQAKNRLHALLHRYHLPLPEGDLFTADHHHWWLGLDVIPVQRVRIQSNLDTLAFAQSQIALFEETLTAGCHGRHLPLPHGQETGGLLRHRLPITQILLGSEI